MLDVYRTYYKMTGEPFRLSPDHRFSLDHSSYANAKAYLQYAIFQGEGFIAVTGGFFYFLFKGGAILPEGDLGKQIIGMLGLIVGTWNAGILSVLTFFFGTSKSSADKNDIVKRALEKP